MGKTNALESTVKIVDGKLILSLPTAESPVVWQMDLEQAQSAAFTITENKKDKNFALVLKSQDGTLDEIALFADKESAMKILMETSSALQNAHGKIKPAAAVAHAPKEKGDKLGAGLAIALIIVLIIIWALSSSVPSKLSPQNSVNKSSAYTGDTNPTQAAGVPVSADDFLSNH